MRGTVAPYTTSKASLPASLSVLIRFSVLIHVFIGKQTNRMRSKGGRRVMTQ